MSLYRLTDLLRYVVCPTKLEYTTDEVTVNPMNKLYTGLLHESLLYLGKNNHFSYKILNHQLNNIWARLKSELPGSDTNVYLAISSRVKQLYKQVHEDISELIAVDYSTTVSVGEHTIDVVIAGVYLSSDRSLVFLYNYPESGYNFTDNSLVSIIYNYISRVISKEDFKHQLPPRVIAYKSNTGVAYSLETSESIVQLKPIVTNILTGVVQKLFYPVVSTSNCVNCNYKDKCKWSNE